MLEELIEVQRLAMEALAVQNKDLMHASLQKILEVTRSLMPPAASLLSSGASLGNQLSTCAVMAHIEQEEINPGDVLVAADGREFKIDDVEFGSKQHAESIATYLGLDPSTAQMTVESYSKVPAQLADAALLASEPTGFTGVTIPKGEVTFTPSSFVAEAVAHQAQDTKDAGEKIASARKAAKGKK